MGVTLGLPRCGHGKVFGWKEASKPMGLAGGRTMRYDHCPVPTPRTPFDPVPLLDNAVSNVICSCLRELLWLRGPGVPEAPEPLQ